MEWHDVLSLTLGTIGALWVLRYRRHPIWWCKLAWVRLRTRTMHRNGLAAGWGIIGRVRYHAEGFYGHGPMYIIVDCPLQEPWHARWFDHFYSIRLTFHPRHLGPHITFGFRAQHELVEKEEIKEIRWTYRADSSDFAEGTIIPEDGNGWSVIATDCAVPLGRLNSTELLRVMLEKRTGWFDFSIEGFQGRSAEVGTLSLNELFSTPVQRYIDDWIQRGDGENGHLQSFDTFPPLNGAHSGSRFQWMRYLFAWWLKWSTSSAYRTDRRKYGWGESRAAIQAGCFDGDRIAYWWESTSWYRYLSRKCMERHVKSLARERTGQNGTDPGQE